MDTETKNPFETDEEDQPHPFSDELEFLNRMKEYSEDDGQ